MANYCTILVNNNNDMIVTKYQNIMQHSKNAHIVKIFVPIMYGLHNMSEFSATMEFIPPNQEYQVIPLEPEPTSEKEDYLQYNVEIKAEYTVFAGEISLAMTFTHTDMDVVKTYVRHTTSCKLPIIPIEKWSELITDEALSELDKRLVEMESQLKLMNNAAETFNLTKADNHRINENGELVLMANGKDLEGTEVSVIIPSVEDDFDNDKSDGIINLDSYYEQETVPEQVNI